MTRAAVSSLIAIAALRAFDDQRAHSVGRFCCCAPRCTVGSYCKKPPKTRLKKFVKSTNHTCACNGLTNFECEGQATWKRKLCEFARNFHGKTREITLGELMFWRIFDIWNHCTERRRRGAARGSIVECIAPSRLS